jgi:plastocyanin
MRRRLHLLILVALVGASLLPATPADAGGFCAGYENETLTDAKGTKVRMVDNCFAPTVLRVPLDGEVSFVNTDPEAHTVGGATGSFGDMHREIGVGDSVTYRFSEEGVYPYVCLVHPGMAGAIVVGDGGPPASAALIATEKSAPSAAPKGGESAAASDERRSPISGTERLLAIAALAILMGAVGFRVVPALRRERRVGAQEA